MYMFIGPQTYLFHFFSFLVEIYLCKIIDFLTLFYDLNSSLFSYSYQNKLNTYKKKGLFYLKKTCVRLPYFKLQLSLILQLFTF